MIKNKSGDTINVNDYRPIPLVPVTSKIFEIILLELLESYLGTISLSSRRVIPLIIIYIYIYILC